MIFYQSAMPTLEQYLKTKIRFKSKKKKKLKKKIKIYRKSIKFYY
jgi:hypothetical protein